MLCERYTPLLSSGCNPPRAGNAVYPMCRRLPEGIAKKPRISSEGCGRLRKRARRAHFAVHRRCEITLSSLQRRQTHQNKPHPRCRPIPLRLLSLKKNWIKQWPRRRSPGANLFLFKTLTASCSFFRTLPPKSGPKSKGMKTLQENAGGGD